MLTCDAFGVLPPIARLSPAQAMYHFLSGFTSKVAGHRARRDRARADLLDLLRRPLHAAPPRGLRQAAAAEDRQHGATCWLVNTGWTGGAYGTGSGCRSRPRGRC
jgi:phosphoenolpyruvate carboxykinase (ATP)